MVSLRYLVTGAIALMAVTVNAAATPQQIADGIKSIAQKSQALQAPAQSISIINAPLIVIGQGPFPVCLRLHHFSEHRLHFLTHSSNLLQASPTLSRLPQPWLHRCPKLSQSSVGVGLLPA